MQFLCILCSFMQFMQTPKVYAFYAESSLLMSDRQTRKDRQTRTDTDTRTQTQHTSRTQPGRHGHRDMVTKRASEPETLRLRHLVSLGQPAREKENHVVVVDNLKHHHRVTPDDDSDVCAHGVSR